MLKSQRPHIGIFGRRNVGKSSVANALAGQAIAIVSPEAGTTTDPVQKMMELTGVGPVVLVDTAGIDDEGELGGKRVARSLATLDAIDLGILVIAADAFGDEERGLARELARRETPFFVLHNKADLAPLGAALARRIAEELGAEVLDFCAPAPTNLEEVVALLRRRLPPSASQRTTILGDLVHAGDLVVLVTPIDVQAPEGRLILPQVQAIRDCLDHDAVAAVVKERELDAFLRQITLRPRLVVTDSQAFLKVAASVPPDVPLTSFSILQARARGDFPRLLAGTPRISELGDGDAVLILESCAHHVAGDDIGRVKIPRWLSAFTGKSLAIDVVAGLDRPPRPVDDYRLVIQCGGCMLTRKQLRLRLLPAIERGIPVTNYGLAIAWCLGVFHRATAALAAGQGSPADLL